MSNIHGLGPVGKKNDNKAGNKDNEEFSVGGAQSGTAVLRPVKGGGAAGAAGGADPMADLIASAKGQAGNPAVHDRNLGLITIYSNGFQIGSGPFRDLKDEKNKAFVEDLKKGVIPRELEPEMRKEWPDAQSVGIQLVNKSTQPYVPDKNAKPAAAKYDFKAGAGQALGGGGAGSSVAANAASFAGAQPKLYVADESEPTTDVQLVSSDRKTKTKVKFNHSATVLDVYQHMAAVTGVSKFELIGGAGLPKPLTNPSLTLKEGNLLGTSFQQKVAAAAGAAGAAGAGRGGGAPGRGGAAGAGRGGAAGAGRGR